MPRDLLYRLPQPVFDEPVFAEGKPTPDPTRFKVPHPSDAQLYKRIEELLYKDVVAFPQSRLPDSECYPLEVAWGWHGPEIVERIQAAGKIVFHAVGDIGASTQGKYPGEIRVSDAVTAESQQATDAERPAFLYLLGDLVYDFGEARYYYDQFYEPYRNYPGPILAIPGNHDSFVVPGTPTPERPLVTFQRNFCAEEPVVTPEAASLHRTAMTEPGVYFALDAPYVRILGLFSNALEDPGVISSEGGRWKSIPDFQLDFLTAQLRQVKSEKFPGALVLAVHHPPFNYAPRAGAGGGGGTHAGNPQMLAQIDQICQAEGVYPHAFFAGHAHNYQRYTRTIEFNGGEYQVPFIVCGGGGHDVDPLVRAHLGSPAQEPANGADVSYLDVHPAVTSRGLVLDLHDDRTYGFLRVEVDATELRIGFHSVAPGGPLDTPADHVVVNLASHSLVSAGSSPPAPTSGSPTTKRKR
jgi:Calcineurin-like phosphoesterase